MTNDESVKPLLRLSALLCICVPIICHVAWIDEPFEASMAGLSGAAYFGKAQHGFDQFGYLSLRGTPLLFHTNADSGSNVPYLNHPPLPHGLLRPFYLLLGKDEAALRVPILILLILSLLGCALLLRVTGRDPELLWIATALFATLPMLLVFGRSVDAPPFCLTAILWTMLAWFSRDASRPVHRDWRFLVLAFTATLMDWFTFFVAPALLLDGLLFRSRTPNRLRDALAGMAPFAAGALAFGVWVFVLAELNQTEPLQHLLAMVPTHKMNNGVGQATAILSYGWRFFGAPVIVFSCIGLLCMARRLVRRQAQKLDRILVALLITGLGPTLIFHERAAVHEFWMLTLSPALAIAAGMGLLWLRSAIESVAHHFKAHLIISTLLLLICSGGVWLGINEYHGFQSDTFRRRGEAINTFATRDDVVLMPSALEATRFYTDVPLAFNISSKDALRGILTVLEPWQHHNGKLFFAVDDARAKEAAFVIHDSIPVLMATNRRIPYDGTNMLSLVELNRHACFEWLRNNR